MQKRNSHKQADSGSALAGFLRPQNRGKGNEAGGFPKPPKDPKKAPDRKKAIQVKNPKLEIPKPTSESVKFRVKTVLREADQGAGTPGGGGKFRVILIQEGLGNLRDCFYYTKECLQNSAQIFEGIKCFADHPNQIEEQIHPERSTRDILGHYEDVEYVELDGRGALEATLILCEGEAFDWAKSLLTNALEYATKYSNAEFVGFSINAQGEAGQADIAEFMQSPGLPEEALAKLQKAQSEGIDEVRPVTALRDAISVDLVTEAGAGGKILTMMERNHKHMKTKKKPVRESKVRKVREDGSDAGDAGGATAGGSGADPGTQDHADAAQDIALFKKMISQYLGDDSGVPSEEALRMAQAAHEECMKQGMEAHEAYEAAGKHLKLSAAIAQNPKMQPQQQEESEETEESEESHEESEESHEESEETEESEESHEESMIPDGIPSKKKGPPQMQKQEAKKLMALSAEVASLKESLRRNNVKTYLEKKLAASGLAPEIVKAFKESLGRPRSEAHIEEAWGFFTAGLEKAEEFGAEGGDIFTENSSGRFRESSGGGDNVISFKDCVK